MRDATAVTRCGDGVDRFDVGQSALFAILLANGPAKIALIGRKG
jgi:hypothetical protein